MNGGGLGGLGGRWRAHRLQPRPGLAWLIVVRPRRGLPDPERSRDRTDLELHACSNDKQTNKPDAMNPAMEPRLTIKASARHSSFELWCGSATPPGSIGRLR